MTGKVKNKAAGGSVPNTIHYDYQLANFIEMVRSPYKTVLASNEFLVAILRHTLYDKDRLRVFQDCLSEKYAAIMPELPEEQVKTVVQEVFRCPYCQEKFSGQIKLREHIPKCTQKAAWDDINQDQIPS